MVILRRVSGVILVLLTVGTVVFFLVHLTPGDPAGYMLGPDATAEDILRLRAALGLDQPLLHQYGAWLWRALWGDLGGSIFLRQPVTTAIADRLEPTLMLTVLAVTIATLAGVLFGTVAALQKGKWIGQGIMTLAAIGVSIPGFWLALNLSLIFGVQLRWLPVAGYPGFEAQGLATLRYLVLPALALGLTEAALIARMTRSSLLEVLRHEYVRTARAKGLAERVVIFRHALRTAAIPILAVIGNSVAVLMGGAIVTETVFNIPGLGRLVVQSILRRDYPVIQGVVLFTAAGYVGINLFLDLMYMRLDPRIRYA